jgi:DNA-binding NtrC family response regulator
VKEAFRYELIGRSASTMELRESILTLKGSNAHVIITGESGTGKELVARRLNAIEDDGKRPFVAVNCGAIAENLVESELFGHKKGSFTGATQDRVGKFEQANGGDLFLDEIGELPLADQVKLLRAIQEGEITRVGDNRSIKVDCRILAATNCNLEQMVRDGKFREDLYHRLNVIQIKTTPLRERTADIADLAKLFVLQIGGANYKISSRAIQALKDYDWPGNVRELRNAVERAVIFARKNKREEIDFEDIMIYRPKEDVLYRMRKIQASLPTNLLEITPSRHMEYLEALEREYFKTALELTNGQVLDLVNRIGLSRSTVFKRLKDLGINQGPAKPSEVSSKQNFINMNQEVENLI